MPRTRAHIQAELDELSEGQRVAHRLTGGDMIYCVGADTFVSFGGERRTTWVSFQSARAKILLDNPNWIYLFQLVIPDWGSTMDNDEAAVIDAMVEATFLKVWNAQ